MPARSCLSSSGIHASASQILLVLAAGARLSAYMGADRGRDRIPAGILDRRFAAAGVAGGLCCESGGRGRSAGPGALREGIRFDHVSFAYPGNSRLALEDISLTLPPGVVVAIVGENGAGKTTLVKLLARMYEPTSGAILIDGASFTDRRKRLAGADVGSISGFLPLRIPRGRRWVGDCAGWKKSPRWSGCRRADAGDVVARLKFGLDTQLGPTWPEGADLRLGNGRNWRWRAVHARWPLVLVLDEPTAALDAETEHALFERYAHAAHGERSNGALRFWFRIGSRRFGWPILSSCWTAPACCRLAHTTNSWRRAGNTRSFMVCQQGLRIASHCLRIAGRLKSEGHCETSRDCA